jgi:hypothetical protein
MAMANIIGEHKAKSKKEKACVDLCGTRFETAARRRSRLGLQLFAFPECGECIPPSDRDQSRSARRFLYGQGRPPRHAALYPCRPYIMFNDAPKVEHLKQAFPELDQGK